jgi:phosphatidylglycerophosphatase A
MRRAAVLLATVFGIGRFPVAPATAAAFVVAAVLALLTGVAPAALAPAPLGLAALVLLPLGIWASGEAEKDLGTDAKPIVIDEVVGMLVSVWGIARLGAPGPWLVLGAAFLLFRVFDILKPFPIRKSQGLPGGYGVVVDDLLAGIATNLVLRALLAIGVLA